MTNRFDDRPILITGGAGFIGSNLADRLARDGHQVIVFDALSREGVERNLAWLKDAHGDRITSVIGDVRDEDRLARAASGVKAAFHFAAQVAVTTSLVDPREDFDINVRGTINLLDTIRMRREPIPVIFASTNKVYGDLGDIPLEQHGERYEPRALIARRGVDESRGLDFHTPYGCSKGAADQYVLDYARSYGLAAAVFRMSCIYGPHQHGTEDQGWVAHFLIRALRDLPITLYGDGRQVRDLLYVDDLVEAFLLAERHLPELAGQAFNIGGGPANTTSLIELIARIARLRGSAPQLTFAKWRTGDQRWYVSDTGKFARATGWQPRVGVAEGVARLCDWLAAEGGMEPALGVAAQ